MPLFVCSIASPPRLLSSVRSQATATGSFAAPTEDIVCVRCYRFGVFVRHRSKQVHPQQFIPHRNNLSTAATGSSAASCRRSSPFSVMGEISSSSKAFIIETSLHHLA
uniref:Uncharacterized protein n=1 Tax=Cucumis melo TaxID=3656 RepID=A0A9I9CU69_CUCME